MKKKIVILAKSIKNGHFCIAGKDLTTGEWIRPVSDKDGSAITREQSKLTFQGASAEPLDCTVFHNVEIDFLQHSPLDFQPENYVISERPWIQHYKFNPNNIFELLDNPETLWGGIHLK